MKHRGNSKREIWLLPFEFPRWLLPWYFRFCSEIRIFSTFYLNVILLSTYSSVHNSWNKVFFRKPSWFSLWWNKFFFSKTKNQNFRQKAILLLKMHFYHFTVYQIISIDLWIGSDLILTSEGCSITTIIFVPGESTRQRVSPPTIHWSQDLLVYLCHTVIRPYDGILTFYTSSNQL